MSLANLQEEENDSRSGRGIVYVMHLQIGDGHTTWPSYAQLFSDPATGSGHQQLQLLTATRHRPDEPPYLELRADASPVGDMTPAFGGSDASTKGRGFATAYGPAALTRHLR